MAEINATQGSLLGLLVDRPMTGWDLQQEIQRGLFRFWNVTSSHVYRELRALEERGLVHAAEREGRDRQPFSITDAGRAAFLEWLGREPGPEQIRFPLLVTLWFGRHLDPDTLAGFCAASRRQHEDRLRLYEGVDTTDSSARTVVDFGIAYERAVIGWLDSVIGRTG